MSLQIDLTGRTAFVTGSTRGIGLTIAQTLYQAGAKVAVIGRDEARAREVAAGLGERATGLACDVSDAASVERAIGAAEAALGPIDILVNNAGITRDNLVLRMSEGEWDEVMAANLKGVFLTTRLVVKGMMKRRWGRIVNITSAMGVSGHEGQSNYAASKAGMIGFTKSIAKEYATRGITANCVGPGFIETDMTGSLPESIREHYLQHEIRMRRFGRPEDVAAAVAFFASDLAGYVTNQVLLVDGGLID
jgi:3-oxoacyl-[acyl-carrier protein] reductase